MDVQDQAETSQNLTVATQDGVDMRFNSAELSLELDDFSERYIEPAVKVLASGIEGDMLASVTNDVYQLAGTPGTPPVTLLSSGDARAKINQQLAPKDVTCPKTGGPDGNGRYGDGDIAEGSERFYGAVIQCLKHERN